MIAIIVQIFPEHKKNVIILIKKFLNDMLEFIYKVGKANTLDIYRRTPNSCDKKQKVTYKKVLFLRYVL